MTNDNALAHFSNGSHSVALAAVGGEYVVSCFAVGADGNIDHDQEFFFKTYSDARIARRIYEGKAKLLKCRAAEFDAAVEWVMRCISSLSSCLDREVPNEARILTDAVKDLTVARLARRDSHREELKASVLDRAARKIAARTEGLAGKIAAEAARRAELGQP